MKMKQKRALADLLVKLLQHRSGFLCFFGVLGIYCHCKVENRPSLVVLRLEEADLGQLFPAFCIAYSQRTAVSMVGISREAL